MERDGAILAHGAAWPVQILTGAEPVSAFQLIDWAADPASAGAGLALASKMFQLADVAYVLGGTAEARRMQAPMGFRPRNRVHLMARPLRPFRQIAVDPRWNWKTPARLARNIWWSASGGGPSDPRWSASPCALADLMDNVPVVDEEPGEMRFGDLRELLASLAECPSVRCALYLVRRDGRPHGYFCMTWAPGQARIVACSVRGSAAEWAQLYRLALDQARSDRRVSEIVTAAATDAQRQALETCGFHSRYADEIALYDRRGRVPADARLHWEMIHGDAAYLHSGRPQFLT